MRGRPRTELKIDALQEGNILTVVASHGGPRLRVTTHATKPEVLPGVWEFAPHAKILAEVVQFIAVKLEVSSGDLEGIDRLVWRRRPKPMGNKPGIRLTEVKAISVVSDDYICLIEDGPKSLD